MVSPSEIREAAERCENERAKELLLQYADDIERREALEAATAPLFPSEEGLP